MLHQRHSILAAKVNQLDTLDPGGEHYAVDYHNANAVLYLDTLQAPLG